MSFHFVTRKSNWIEEETNEFYQSWEYGEFLSLVGRYVIRVSDGEFFWQGTVHTLPAGARYIYFPRIKNRQMIHADFFLFLKNQGYIFARIEPTEEILIQDYQVYPAKNRQTQHTLLIDLTTDEKELKKEMHQKTRYNMRLAERKGVCVRDEKIIGIYSMLQKTTATRQRFVPYDTLYITKFLKMENTKQFTAYYKNHPVATAIVLHYKDTVSYIFGASADIYREVMAPYLLHWRIMQNAKMEGIKWYDLFGVAPPIEKAKHNSRCHHRLCWEKTHPLANVTQFKAGFGGKIRSYPSAIEVVFSPLYYHIYKGMRHMLGKQKIVGHPL